MSVLCPKCDKINLCACESCNPDSKKENVIIEYRDEDLYQCYFCGARFNPVESMDYEWDIMIKEFIDKATPEICYEWMVGATLDGWSIDRKYLLDKYLKMGEFGIIKAIESHFNEPYDKIAYDRDKLLNIRLELIREKKINQIL